MHKIAISEAAMACAKRQFGKLHPFEAMDPRSAALLVIDMQRSTSSCNRSSVAAGSAQLHDPDDNQHCLG